MGEYGGHPRDEFCIFNDGESLWLMCKVLKIVVKWNLSQLGYLKNWSQPANMAGNGNFMSIRTLFMNNAIQFCCRGNFSRPYVVATWVWDMNIIGSPPLFIVKFHSKLPWIVNSAIWHVWTNPNCNPMMCWQQDILTLPIVRWWMSILDAKLPGLYSFTTDFPMNSLCWGSYF